MPAPVCAASVAPMTAAEKEAARIFPPLLADAGFAASLKRMDAAAYLRWLAAEKLANTAANRAAFVGL